MTRVLSASSNRADLSILAPVWAALAEHPDVELHLLLTGQHATQTDLATTAVPDKANVHYGGADPSGTTPNAAAQAMASITGHAAKVFTTMPPDVVLVIGDRIDMFPVAAATVPFNLPLVHLHGGELSYGALDDRLRHAISKLAHLHCVSCRSAAENLIRMGEPPERIHVTGAPGLDTLRTAPDLDSLSLKHAIGLEDLTGLRLVTLHPETNGGDSLRLVDETIAALETNPAPTLVTAPNSDPGAADMERVLRAWVERTPWASWRDTLGMARYPAVMRRAAVMVGNSSSGIVEAPFLGLPVINIGTRQAGRLRGRNVLDVPCDRTAIAKALEHHPRQAPQDSVNFQDFLYGDGWAAQRIAAVIAEAPMYPGLLDKQLFLAAPETAPAIRLPWAETSNE